MRRICISFLLIYIAACLLPKNGVTQQREQDIQDVSLDSLLNTQISSASKYAQKTSEAPASVTIITSEDIERYGYRTLEEVFQSVRGFYVSNDRNYSYVGVRGFSRPTDYNDRILLLINGHTLNENVYGSAMIGTELGLDLGGIERIEIVRGPGSALYGTNAMFAVVNIITKKGNAINGFKLSGETGSYGRLQGAGMFGKEFDNGMEMFISGLGADIKGQNLYYREYDQLSTNYGIAQNLDWDKYHGILATMNYHDFNLQGVSTSRKKGIPTGAFETAFNGEASWTLDERSFMELKYDHKLGVDKNIMLRGYFDHYHYKGAYPYAIVSYDASDGNWWGGESQFWWDLASSNRLTIGAEYQNHLRADYRLWDAEVTYFNDDFPFQVSSFYLQDEYQMMSNLSLNLGIRRDEYSTVGSSTTPRYAIVYNPIKSGTLKLLYGDAFRAPNVYEVDYEDSVSGYKANPTLKPEKISTMEIIWEQRLSQEWLGVVSFYNYEMRDLIDQRIDPSDSLVQFQNVSRVKAKGVELELNAHLKMGLSGYANYAFQNAEDPSLKEKLTNSPSHIAKLGLSYPVMKNFHASTELLYETGRITVYGTKTDPYLLTNIHLSSPSLFRHIELSLLIRNLFNVAYKTPGGYEHLQDAITQNGRDFSVKMEYKF
jgi:outer membrane receptor for ferrienterochelin and colicins